MEIRVHESKKHNMKPNDRSILEKGKDVRKHTEPAPVCSPKRSIPVVQPKAARYTHLLTDVQFWVDRSSSIPTENQSSDRLKEVMKKLSGINLYQE